MFFKCISIEIAKRKEIYRLDRFARDISCTPLRCCVVSVTSISNTLNLLWNGTFQATYIIVFRKFCWKFDLLKIVQLWSVQFGKKWIYFCQIKLNRILNILSYLYLNNLCTLFSFSRSLVGTKKCFCAVFRRQLTSNVWCWWYFGRTSENQANQLASLTPVLVVFQKGLWVKFPLAWYALFCLCLMLLLGNSITLSWDLLHKFSFATVKKSFLF